MFCFQIEMFCKRTKRDQRLLIDMFTSSKAFILISIAAKCRRKWMLKVDEWMNDAQLDACSDLS